MQKTLATLTLVTALTLTGWAQSEEPAVQPKEATTTSATLPDTKPYRTFVTIKRYNLINNGIPSKAVSNVQLLIKFPGNVKTELPEGGHYWSIGNNQTQEINRTFEIPWGMIQKDGFNMDIQMSRAGKKILPCHFEISQISQFNRSYVCRTDVAFQKNEKMSDDSIADEGIEIRVFSDRNSPASEIPSDAIAIRK